MDNKKLLEIANQWERQADSLMSEKHGESNPLSKDMKLGRIEQLRDCAHTLRLLVQTLG